MPPEPPTSREANSIIIRPSTDVVTLPDGGSPALPEMISRSLIHIQTSKSLSRLHRIGEHELRWPDYHLVCSWAEQLNMSSEVVLKILLGPQQAQDRWELKTTLVDGYFIRLGVDERLKGIRELPSIEGLRIEKLALIKLDLSSFNLPPVPNLTHLWCSGNQLINLDLTPVPNLTMLFCDENQLTDLDLTPVPNLTKLFCDGNQLTDLDLTAVPNLTKLFCDGNQLTDLDLTAVLNLTELWCSGNQLTVLDLTPVPNLEWLTCEENQLSQLDIRTLKSLNGVYYDNSTVTLMQRSDQNF